MTRTAPASSAELSLPPALLTVLGRTIRVLSAHLDQTTLWLGGGTALAARWNHRHSTDIDLFYDEGRRSDLEMSLASLFRHLHALALRGEIVLKAVRPQGATWTADDVPVSLYPSRIFHLAGSPNDSVTVQDQKVAVEPSADILLKKLRARMLHSQEYLSRDLYDLITAHVEDPGAVRAAFEHLLADERAMLRYDGEHHPIRARMGRDIADAAYPALASQPDVLIRYARLALTGRLVRRELDALRRLRQPPRGRITGHGKGDTQGHG